MKCKSKQNRPISFLRIHSLLCAIIIVAIPGCAPTTQLQSGVEKPAWVESGKHPAYPDSLFMAGVGLANITRDAARDRSLADASAVGEIIKRIKSRVIVKDIHITTQQAVASQSLQVSGRNSSLSVAEIYSDMVLNGVAVVQRYTDRKAGLVYSLAALNRCEAASAMQEEIVRLKRHYHACLGQMDQLLNQHRFLRALWYAKEAAISHNLGTERQNLAGVIRASPDSDETAWLKPFASPLSALQKAEEILSGLILEKKAGDNQQLMPGALLSEPLTVGLYFCKNGEKYPVEGALILFNFRQGQAVHTDSAYTNPQGMASCTVHQVEAATQNFCEISATVDFSPILGTPIFIQKYNRKVGAENLPPPWQNLVHSIKKQVVFQIRLQTDSIQSKARYLAQNLADGLPDDSKLPLRIAIANLTYQNSRVSSPFLSYFQDQLAMQLTQLRRFLVIKGKELEAKIRTRSISVAQTRAPDSPEGIRDLTGTDAVVVGKCWEKDDRQISIIVDIIANSSHAALASASVLIQKNEIPANLPLLPENFPDIQQNMAVWDDLSFPGTELKVKLWVDHLDGGVYKAGDKMTVFVRSNKTCYLYLIYHDVNGNDLLIFPNHYRQNNRIISNTTYQIPGKSDRFDFTVVPPCGIEILKAFASTHPLPDLPGKAIGGGIKRLKLSPKKLAESLRGVIVTERQEPGYAIPTGPVERAEASCVVTTVCR